MAAPAIIGALFAEGSRVQISSKYSSPTHRGQIGTITKVAKKGGAGQHKNKWQYSIAIEGKAFADVEDVNVLEEFLSATITPLKGRTVKRRVGNNSQSKSDNNSNSSNNNNNNNNNTYSNSNSDNNSSSDNSQMQVTTKKKGTKNNSNSASGGGGLAADDSDGSLSSIGSTATADLSEVDDNNDIGSEYEDDLIMDCNLVDDAAVVEIKVEEDGINTIRVGPSASTIKREWKNCKSVEYDPSTQGDRRFKGVCQVNWNGTEMQTPASSRSPFFYFQKSFPMDYLQKIEEYTNKELRYIYQNANPALLADGELLHVIGIRLAMTLDPKKGGLDIHWDPYDEDTEGVILGGNFKQRFETSKNRFQKVFQAFRLEDTDKIKRHVGEDPWAELRPFYDAVNSTLESAITPGATIVIDESMSSWHGLSTSFDAEGCPHVTKIQRKPEGIGVEYKALADGYSGVIIKLEVMEGAERMSKLKYTDKYNAGTASLLRLTDSPTLQDSWRTVVGDSAFGSVQCAIAADVERGLYFMGAIKTAHSFFPASYLLKLPLVQQASRGTCYTLQSSYKSRDGQDRVLLATAWNDKKTKLIVSTCGTTSAATPSSRSRSSVYMDSDSGLLETKKNKKVVPRNNIVFKFHEYFGAVDIHNHLRQGSLGFERHWKTKKFSHRFFMTLLGICITNAFRMYEMEYRESGLPLKDKFDFTTFLDKLAYELIFNKTFYAASGLTKRGLDEVVSNSSSNSKRRKTTKKVPKARDDGDDGDDERDNIHRFMTFAQRFPKEAKKFSQTIRINCKECNAHRTAYFCLDCSDSKADAKNHNNFHWICSPATSNNEHHSQCFANHVLGLKGNSDSNSNL